MLGHLLTAPERRHQPRSALRATVAGTLGCCHGGQLSPHPRRVSVCKKNRGSPESLRASQTLAELQPAEDTEDEAAAWSRPWRKTGSPEPAQENDSEEDMFGDYNSFTENSFLAQVDDLEQKFMQLPEHGTHERDSGTRGLCSEDIKTNLGINTVSDFTDSETNEHTKRQSDLDDPGEPEPGSELSFDVPSSQILYFENMQNSSKALGDQSTKERDGNSHKSSNDDLPYSHIEQPQQNNDFSNVGVSSEMSRRKSIRDHLKSAMAGNARAQTPGVNNSERLSCLRRSALLRKPLSHSQMILVLFIRHPAK